MLWLSTTTCGFSGVQKQMNFYSIIYLSGSANSFEGLAFVLLWFSFRFSFPDGLQDFQALTEIFWPWNLYCSPNSLKRIKNDWRRIKASFISTQSHNRKSLIFLRNKTQMYCIYTWYSIVANILSASCCNDTINTF